MSGFSPTIYGAYIDIKLARRGAALPPPSRLLRVRVRLHDDDENLVRPSVRRPYYRSLKSVPVRPSASQPRFERKQTKRKNKQTRPENVRKNPSPMHEARVFVLMRAHRHYIIL